MKTITINNKEYNIKKIDFNALCELEDLGFAISEVKNKTFKTLRALVAFVADCDVEKASEIIEQHLKNGGGKIDDFTPLFTMVSESDFFRNISQ